MSEEYPEYVAFYEDGCWSDNVDLRAHSICATCTQLNANNDHIAEEHVCNGVVIPQYAVGNSAFRYCSPDKNICRNKHRDTMFVREYRYATETDYEDSDVESEDDQPCKILQKMESVQPRNRNYMAGLDMANVIRNLCMKEDVHQGGFDGDWRYMEWSESVKNDVRSLRYSVTKTQFKSILAKGKLDNFGQQYELRSSTSTTTTTATTTADNRSLNYDH